MNLAALFDLGHVIAEEETEVKSADGNTQCAKLVDGMGDALSARSQNCARRGRTTQDRVERVASRHRGSLLNEFLFHARG